MTKLSLSLQSRRCPCKVDVVRTKHAHSVFVQSCRCPCKVDVVRTKCEHYSYKVVVVLAKLTLFVQSVNIIRTKSSLSFYLVNPTCYLGGSDDGGKKIY